MAEVLRALVLNIPAVMFVIALAMALLVRGEGTLAERLLRWLLLLPVGVSGIWAGLFHVFLPEAAAGSIGWQVSPFQFEIGIADLACGIVAVAAFWRSYPFQAAIGWYETIFLWGVAFGHVHQAIVANNFAPNNFGLLLLVTVMRAVLLPVLIVIVGRRRAHGYATATA